MRDIDRALADIVTIRTQLARQSAFSGYGPATIAATGGLAAVVTILQARYFADAVTSVYFAIWIAAALAAFALVGIEAVTRTRRLHSRLADEMIVAAIELFAPAAAAGALIGLVLARFEPGSLWMLPGLWQIMVGLGLFAASRALPRMIVVAAAWYVVAGLAVLAIASASHVLSPWMMGTPFAIGQLVAAAALHRGLGGRDGD